MFKILTILSLVAVPGISFATNTTPPEAPASSLNQTQQQQQGQSTASSQNVSTSPVQTSSVSLTQKGVRQAPDVFLSSSNTTAPCMVAVGGGVSVPGAGFGFGGGKKDKGCEMRSRIELYAKFDKQIARGYACDHDADLLRLYIKMGKDCYAPEVIVIPAIAAAPQVINILPQPAATVRYYSKQTQYRKGRSSYRQVTACATARPKPKPICTPSVNR